MKFQKKVFILAEEEINSILVLRIEIFHLLLEIYKYKLTDKIKLVEMRDFIAMIEIFRLSVILQKKIKLLKICKIKSFLLLIDYKAEKIKTLNNKKILKVHKIALKKRRMKILLICKRIIKIKDIRKINQLLLNK